MRSCLPLFLSTFIISVNCAFASPEECSFCRKDHQNICESECMDENNQYGKSDDCQAKCVVIKCKSVCEEVVKSKDEKTDKLQESTGQSTPKAGSAKKVPAN